MDWSTLGDAGLQVLGFLLPVIAVVGSIVVAALVKKLLDWLGVKRSEKIDEMIDKYVGIGVNAAERTARKKLDGRQLDRNDKLNIAVKTVLGELEQSGIRGVTTELVKARIEDYLEIRETSGPKLEQPAPK